MACGCTFKISSLMYVRPSWTPLFLRAAFQDTFWISDQDKPKSALWKSRVEVLLIVLLTSPNIANSIISWSLCLRRPLITSPTSSSLFVKSWFSGASPLKCSLICLTLCLCILLIPNYQIFWVFYLNNRGFSSTKIHIFKHKTMLIRLKKFNLVNANHSHGWHTTFAFLIKVFLSMPDIFPAFLLFSPGPTGEGTQWETAWVLFRIKPWHLHNTKFEKENNKKVGHYCAWRDMFVMFCLFIFLIKGILHCWIQKKKC